MGTLLGADLATLARYDGDEAIEIEVFWAAEGERQDATGRWPLERGALAETVFRTAQAARQDDWSTASGPLAEYARELAIHSSVASPIVVQGRPWGVLFVHSKHDGLPEDTESRLSNFTDLVATSIANAQARAEVRRLVSEQASLRRVATLVAQAVPNAEVFEAVTREAGMSCDADLGRMERSTTTA